MKKILLILISISIMATILYFSSQSSEISNATSMGLAKKMMLDVGNTEKVNLWVTDILLRKFAHLIEYLLLSVAVYRVFEVLIKIPVLAGVISTILCISFAIYDERSQLLAHGRTYSVFDIAVDGTGIVVGMAVVTILLVGRKEVAK